MFKRKNKIKVSKSVKKISVVKKNQNSGYTWSNIAKCKGFVKKYGTLEE